MPENKILVTGGTGYIGSHTVVELINAGYIPVIVDNYANSSPKIIDQIEAITGIRPEHCNLDLCDEASTAQFISHQTDISGIIHFAAFKAVGESVAEPLKYYRNNLSSLLNLLEAFRGKPVNLVFSSSCTVYGEPDELPVTENASVKVAESPYGNTKQIAEEILRDVTAVDRNFHVTSLRYFNPVGAHSSALIGELPIGVPQNLVPFITQSAAGKRGPITVYGNNYNTPDGSCVRDYIHVVDLAKAHVSAIKRMESDAVTENYSVFNIGTGKGSTVLEVINAFKNATGVKLDYTIGPRRDGDVEKIYGNVEKASEILGWKAQLDLDEMMRSAWAWEKYLRENPL